MYLFKSAVSLAVLMLFYKLLLEKENMHVFKRFYLLGALVISFSVPFITFTTYVESTTANTAIVYQSINLSEENQILADILPYFLWSLYAAGVLFCGAKFFHNLRMILLRIRHNQKDKTGCATIVLLEEEVIPHTFWNFIFVNQKKYDRHKIPPEVFEHERAHARQRHTVDILFVEILQVVFWFNPLIYIVKHFIKMNHEFLADRAVLQKGIQTSAYQQILLTFSSDALTNNLANSINYSLIKKRFTVMKTHTTKKAIWARSLLLLPLLALLIYSCSTVKALENHSTYEEGILEVPYAIITNNGIRDTIGVEVMFDLFSKPATIYHTKNGTIELNHDNLNHSYDIDPGFFSRIKKHPYFSNCDTIADAQLYVKE